MRIVWLILLVLLVGGGFYAWTRLEREPPTIGTLTSAGFANREYRHEFRFLDTGTGVEKARIWLEANGKEHELASEHYEGNPFSGAALGIERTIEVVVDPQRLGLSDGPAVLHAESTDFAWMPNTASVEIALTVDTKPPRASLLTGLTYVRRGGAELAMYTLEEAVEKHGIQVGESFFSGYADSTDKKRNLAFYAIPANGPDGARPALVVADRAGNQTKIELVANIQPRAFPEDTIQLTEAFMQEKVAELLEPGWTGTPLDGYLKINRELRQANDAKIAEICSSSGPERIWSGAFAQMPNTQARANFAERRSYVYDGQVVDQQTHMGFDFASTSHAPVPAANDGVVVFAGPLGIYGNTVIVDHGLGLHSLYGHLSEIAAEKGRPVSKGETLGKSGKTGLAGGDHLHFAMILEGQFVDPLEWFDKKWIDDHIEGKIAAANALAQ